MNTPGNKRVTIEKQSNRISFSHTVDGLNPIRSFAILVAAIFSIELLIMIVFLFAPPMSNLIESLVDATSLTILVTPILYRFAILPLYVQISELRKLTGDKERLNNTLEQQIEKRSSELAAANKKNERRAAQFEAIAQVSRTISSTQDLNTLLPQIASVISRLFGFYHVGIFLLDERGEYAILSAANSEGGQRMLARDLRLRVGETGIVGDVTATGDARVALDTGADAVFFNNPDLPYTHSEIALPLKVGGQVIGALDVQSKESNAFAEEDVSILSTLAEQVGVAIQNARQYEKTRRALAESETLSSQFVQQGWQQFTKGRNLAGIHHTGAKSTLLYTKNGTKKDQARLESGGTSLALPVKLRGEVIGMVNVHTPDSRGWNQDDLDIVNAIIERAAVALENARLLAESQKRAAKERTISDISSKISAQSDIDELLKTAAQELSRTLPKAHISIQFKKEEEIG